MRIQPRAEYLHARGPAQLLDDLAHLLGPELGPIVFSVSRLDLFTDVQGWMLSLDDAHHFVCWADAHRTHEVDGTLTGFEFGSRKNKSICARIYDKTADIEAKGTAWWYDVWCERFVTGQPVHRVEFELGRRGLRDFDVDTPARALEAMGDLSRYATTEWLTHRSPAADTTRSRWPVSSSWRAVQKASLRYQAVGFQRRHQTRRQTSVARLMPGLTGYLVSFAALAGVDGIDETLGVVAPHLLGYEVVSRTSFAERVARRRAQLDAR